MIVARGASLIMRISVHPLFILFGAYYVATNRIFEFIAFTVTAVIHETGHSVVAESLGYKLNKIVLMPFGAAAKGDVDGLKLKDEIKIALAGPAVNVAIGLLFVATWWIFPETYAFTDTAAYANFSMAAVNLIPVYPLDGGRVVFASFAKKTGRVKAERISAILGAVCAAMLAAGFIVTLFYSPNFSLLFFASFALVGAFSKEKENVYVKIFSGTSERKLMRGVPIIRQAISKRATIKKLMSVIDTDSINEIVVYDGEKRVATLLQGDILNIINNGEIYDRLEKFI